MRYKVLICGNGQFQGANSVPMNLDEAIKRVPDCCLWHRREEMETDIKNWAIEAANSEMFFAGSAVLVCVAESCDPEIVEYCPHCKIGSLDYDKPNPTSYTRITQRVTCHECGFAYEDTFVFSERKEL